MTTPKPNPRNDRQSAIFPEGQLTASSVSIVGVGAIGRQVAMQLAAVGVPRIQLIDFDTVEDVNLGPQGWNAGDVGKAKVEACAAQCRLINPEIQVDVVNGRYSAALELNSTIIACVDSIDVRRLIWEHLADRAWELFIDGRMAVRTIRTVVATPAEKDHYPDTLFREDEAVPMACTAKATVFTSNIAAGMIVNQYSKFLQGLPIDTDVICNLLSMEMFIPQPDPRPAEADGDDGDDDQGDDGDDGDHG